MPCWGSYFYSVQAPTEQTWGTVAPQLDRLARAAQSIGWRAIAEGDALTLIRADGATIRLTRNGTRLDCTKVQQTDLRVLRQAYGLATVRETAGKMGFREAFSRTLADGRIQVQLKR